MFKTASKSDSSLSSPTSAGLNSTTTSNATCIIAKGTTIEGKFTSSENVLINGTIKGEVFCHNRLSMGSTGWIEGTIYADSATIKGYINGTIVVQNILHLESTAKIEGIILAKSIEVDEGAQYNGECKIGERYMKEVQPQAA